MISSKENARELLGLEKVNLVDYVASEFSEVEFVAGDAEVFDDVRNNAARHVARMPRESDNAVGAERAGVMSVTAGVAEVFTADFAETTLQLAAVERGVFAHRSGSENEFVAKSQRNGSARFQQGFQMSLGRLLEMENRFAPITTMRVATGQQPRLGNPHSVLIASRLDFRDGNYHNAETIPISAGVVNAATLWNELIFEKAV
jgi:hypothetical protein